jgi:hypothetical protein
VIRLAAAAICVLVGLYWLSVGYVGSHTSGGGFRLLVAIFTSAWLAAALYPLVPRRIGVAAAWVFPVVALGLGVFAAVGPWLLSQWIHADFDRYVWVIRQGDPCSGMGGGPGMIWVFGTSWLAAVGALVYAGTSRLSAPRVVGGLGLGAAMLGATAAAMFPNPALFARILGCM